MSKKPYPHRYYRSIVGCKVYFCPIRRMDAFALIKHQSTYWIDIEWALGEFATMGTGREQITDTRSTAMALMHIHNQIINEYPTYQLDPLIDTSFDEFERMHGVGSYWASVKAAQKA